jgi:hypothetical protein
MGEAPDKLEVVQIMHPTEGLSCVVCFNRHETFEGALLVFDGKSLCTTHYEEASDRMLTIEKKGRLHDEVRMG